MVDYLTPDWHQERPVAAQFESDWRSAIVPGIDDIDPKLEALASNLRATHINGGALLAQFHLNMGPAASWFLTRNRLPETAFFRRFFEADLVRRRLHGVKPAWQSDDLAFELDSSFTAIGKLASIVSHGGAYKSTKSDTEVVELVCGFAKAAFGNRYSEISAYLSWKPWAPWFKNVAWDSTFFLIDKRTAVATVLLITDTD